MLSSEGILAVLNAAPTGIGDAVRTGYRSQRRTGIPAALTAVDAHALAAALTAVEDWLELRPSARRDVVRAALGTHRRALEAIAVEPAKCLDFSAVRAACLADLSP